MPVYDIAELKDKPTIRQFLERDRGYAAYALGDLEPPYDKHATWFGAHLDGELEGLALIFDNLEPPALFLMGTSPSIGALMTHGVGPDEVYFNAQPEQQPLLETWYKLLKPTAMYRMQLTPERFRPATESKFPIQKLDASMLDEVNAFFKLGAEADERIIAFTGDQVRDGFFYGVRLEDQLIAVAGTHVVAKLAKLAAIGNVLTHPDYRGRGLGKATSDAVTAALFEAGMETVVLNVAQDNQPAIKIYEALGFQRVGPFIEGQAIRL
jgi:ribosomal protein S18 acetylase RimI-like enzyme